MGKVNSNESPRRKQRGICNHCLAGNFVARLLILISRRGPGNNQVSTSEISIPDWPYLSRVETP